MSWFSGIYLYLGRCAPDGTNATQIKNALLKQTATRVICATDRELNTIKSGLRKIEVNKERKKAIYNSGTSGEMASYREQGLQIKPSEIKLARKNYTDALKTDREKYSKAIEKLKVLQENSRKRAEEERLKKVEEMKFKEEERKKFEEEAKVRLRKALEEKDIEMGEFLYI